MSINIREVKTNSDRKKFVELQFELYKDNKFWVPPLKKAEINYLDPNHNPAFNFSKAKFFIAEKNGKTVGRIGAVINEKYNQKTGKKYVRIVKPEFIDDYEVSNKLLQTVQDFGKENKMEIMHGPLGFTNLDNQGMLIEGFDELQSVASVYHLPYYKEHFEKFGLTKENDWVEYHLKLTKHALEKGNKGSALIKKRYGFEIKNFSSTKEMKKFAPKVFEIINEAFADLPYVTSFDKKMQSYYTNKYFDIINPKYVKAVTKNSEIVGFVIAVPSMSKAMQKANGKLFPFGIFHILKARKKNDTADLFLTGVRKKHEKEGVAVLLFTEMQNALLADGIEDFETTGVFETNLEVLNNWKRYDGRQHKRRRCFVKNI
jgi:hypothetical protein